MSAHERTDNGALVANASGTILAYGHGQPFGNGTQPNETDVYHPITTFIEIYSLPVVSIFGLIGNTFASVVFLQKPFRNSSCSIFLAVRGISDNGFLSTLFMIWISRTFELHLGMMNESCRVIIFLSYVCGYISAWLVVFVTLENYFRICRPFCVRKFCTVRNAQIIITILCLTSIGLYNFPFWAMSSGECDPYSQFHNIVKIFVYIDTVITLVLPLICIAVMLSAIIYRLVRTYKFRNRLKSRTPTSPQSTMAKVTNMLLAVTLTFFCFCLPSHIYRITFMLSNPNRQKIYNSIREEAIQHIVLLIYYFSLSTNIIVYAIFGSRFRKVAKSMLISSMKMLTCRRKT